MVVVPCFEGFGSMRSMLDSRTDISPNPSSNCTKQVLLFFILVKSPVLDLCLPAITRTGYRSFDIDFILFSFDFTEHTSPVRADVIVVAVSAALFGKMITTLAKRTLTLLFSIESSSPVSTTIVLLSFQPVTTPDFPWFLPLTIETMVVPTTISTAQASCTLLDFGTSILVVGLIEIGQMGLVNIEEEEDASFFSQLSKVRFLSFC
jgi:hypothetical protein